MAGLLSKTVMIRQKMGKERETRHNIQQRSLAVVEPGAMRLMVKQKVGEKDNTALEK